jgi:hypothetical protein
MRFKNEVFRNISVDLDFNEFIDCRFYNCRLVFRGLSVPTLSGCYFADAPNFFLDGAATNVLVFLRLLQAHGLSAVVDKFVEEIRTPTQMPQPLQKM